MKIVRSLLGFWRFTLSPGGSRGGPGGVTGNPARPTPPSPVDFYKIKNSKIERHGDNAVSLLEN